MDDPDADRRRMRQWLAGIWIFVTLLILLSMTLVVVIAWPPTVVVFFIGIWLVVTVRAAFAFKPQRNPTPPPRRR